MLSWGCLPLSCCWRNHGVVANLAITSPKTLSCFLERWLFYWLLAVDKLAVTTAVIVVCLMVIVSVVIGCCYKGSGVVRCSINGNKILNCCCLMTRTSLLKSLLCTTTALPSLKRLLGAGEEKKRRKK